MCAVVGTDNVHLCRQIPPHDGPAAIDAADRFHFDFVLVRGHFHPAIMDEVTTSRWPRVVGARLSTVETLSDVTRTSQTAPGCTINILLKTLDDGK